MQEGEVRLPGGGDDDPARAAYLKALAKENCESGAQFRAG